MRNIFAGAALLALSVSHIAFAAPTIDVTKGNTKVQLASGFVSALGTLGVVPSADSNARLMGATITFPAVAGSVDAANAKGEIIHQGNLILTAGDTVVSLGSFIIDTTGAAPLLTGLVQANDAVVGRLPLFTVTLPALTLPLQAEAQNMQNVVTLTHARLALTSEAAGALNDVFGLSGGNALAAGVDIGTATVTIRENSRIMMPTHTSNVMNGAGANAGGTQITPAPASPSSIKDQDYYRQLINDRLKALNIDTTNFLMNRGM
jgi:hypothetical protein